MHSFCGYVAIVGRPNVGKSTLLNRLVGQKLSITSRKPQTTRHTVLGIQTDECYQCLYVDTPGLHLGEKKRLNQSMNQLVLRTLHDVDAIIVVVDALRWTEEDDYVFKCLAQVKAPCFLAINKVDSVLNKDSLLPLLLEFEQRHPFVEMIPLSARTGRQVNRLFEAVKKVLPEGPHLFDEDQLTDRPVKFLCAELLREKVFRCCGEELPYSVTVLIESFKEEAAMVRIHALILVEKDSHKGMIIGDHGQKLKEMATQARLDMERLLDKKVMLKCWCKVKTGWSDDDRLLREFGYEL